MHPKVYKDSYVATRLVEVSTTLIVTADVIPVSGGGGVSGCVVEPEVVPEVEPVVEPEVVPVGGGPTGFVEPEVVPEVEPEVEPVVEPVGAGGDVGCPDGGVVDAVAIADTDAIAIADAVAVVEGDCTYSTVLGEQPSLLTFTPFLVTVPHGDKRAIRTL